MCATSIVICILYNVEYLNTKRKYKNFTKEVMLQFEVIFAKQSTGFVAVFEFNESL